MELKRVTRISPASAWHLPDLRELWDYRELLVALGMRDIRVRYRQTVLGVAWAVLQPLASMTLFTLIFGRFARIPSDGMPYAVFVYAGLLPWMLFSATLSGAAASVVGASGFITRVWFPRLLIPAASVAAPIVDFVISSLILLVLMTVYGVDLTARLLTIPLLAALLVLLAASIGTILSALVVTYRDVRFVIPFLVQFWMFASPVVYPASIVPERYRWILQMNPMTGIIDTFRWAFLGTRLDHGALVLSIVITGCTTFVSILYFRHVEERFADVI